MLLALLRWQRSFGDWWQVYWCFVAGQPTWLQEKVAARQSTWLSMSPMEKGPTSLKSTSTMGLGAISACGKRSWLGESYGLESYEIKNVANGTYEAHKEYELMKDEGMEVEYDEGKEEKYDMIGGLSLAGMNEVYRNINGMVYMVNFVYINVYKYLTAELYMVMVTIYALWMWRKRSTRKRTRKARKSHLSYYRYKLRGKVLRPEVLWSEDSSRGLTEPCGLEVGEDAVLHVPVARHEKRRQRLNELCQQKKLRRLYCGWQ